MSMTVLRWQAKKTLLLTYLKTANKLVITLHYVLNRGETMLFLDGCTISEYYMAEKLFHASRQGRAI